MQQQFSEKEQRVMELKVGIEVGRAHIQFLEICLLLLTNESKNY